MYEQQEVNQLKKQTDSIFASLIQAVSELDGVQSIGRSGGRPLPTLPADGDIDVFLYCDAIPSSENRSAVLDSIASELGDITMDAIDGGRWGIGDLVFIGGVETWLMYFTVEAATDEVDTILLGEQPGKEGNYFYPTGRCAMYLGMEVLCDKAGFLKAMKERLSVYPEELSTQLTQHHLNALGDTEDLERAVARKDVLFYHFALDLALDHFLQALFAMNRVFFPSRKRSLEYIQGFMNKPLHCEERLLEIVRLGGSPEEMEQSLASWRELVRGLKP